MLKTIKIKRITEEIVSQIREHIAKGELKAGDRLPSERDMALQLGVSRPTVREALQVLEHTGFVEILQGSGTYIRDIGEQTLMDPLQILIHRSDERYRHVYEFRTAIEVWAVGLAAERIDSDGAAQLSGIIEKMKVFRAEKKPVDELDAEFHLAIARASQNDIYFHVARTILHLLTQATHISHKELFLSEGDQAEIMKDHEAIFDAIVSHDAEKARSLMRHHLKRVTIKTAHAHQHESKTPIRP